MRVLVLGAGGPAANGYCKALRMAGGYTLIGANPDKYDLATAPVDERICGENTLLDLVDIAKPDFVHAQPEEEVLRLSDHEYDLEELGVRTYLPDHRDIEVTQDKLETAKRLGALAPEITNQGDVWVRPRRGAGGKDARRDRDVITTYRWMSQRYVPGFSCTWQSLWWKGRLLWNQGRERLVWTHGDRGASKVTRTIDDEVMIETGLKACERINDDPHGIWNVDMIRDPDGRYWVTEINAGRFNTCTPEMYATLGSNVAAHYTRATAPFGGIPLMIDVPVFESGWLWIRQWDREPILIHERDIP